MKFQNVNVTHIHEAVGTLATSYYRSGKIHDICLFRTGLFLQA